MGRFSTMPSNQIWVIVNIDRQKNAGSMIGEKKSWPITLSIHITFVERNFKLLCLTQVEMGSKSSRTGFPVVTKAQFKSCVLENVFETYT